MSEVPERKKGPQVMKQEEAKKEAAKVEAYQIPLKNFDNLQPGTILVRNLESGLAHCYKVVGWDKKEGRYNVALWDGKKWVEGNYYAEKYIYLDKKERVPSLKIMKNIKNWTDEQIAYMNVRNAGTLESRAMRAAMQEAAPQKEVVKTKAAGEEKKKAAVPARAFNWERHFDGKIDDETAQNLGFEDAESLKKEVTKFYNEIKGKRGLNVAVIMEDRINALAAVANEEEDSFGIKRPFRSESGMKIAMAAWNKIFEDDGLVLEAAGKKGMAYALKKVEAEGEAEKEET